MSETASPPGATDLAFIGQHQAHPARTLSAVYVSWALSIAGTQLFSILLFFLLPADLAGLINWGTAAGATVFYIAEGGVETALVVAAKQHHITIGRMVSAVGVIRAVTAAVALTAWMLAVMLHWLDALQATVLLLVGVGFVLRLLQTPFTAALQVRDRQASVAAVNLAGAATRLAALFLVWAAGQVSVQSALIASIAGDLAALGGLATISFRLPVRDIAIDPSIGQLFRRLIRTAPLITATQAITIAQGRVDWLLVAAFTSYAALANYSIANKALELFMLAGSVFGRTALPWFVEGWNSRQIIGPLRALMTIVSSGGLALAVAGKSILHLAFGVKYAGADAVIGILAGLAPALVALLIVQFAMIGKERAMDTVVAGAAAVAAQIAFDLLAIPRLGIVGAAYGMCAFAAVAFPLTLTFAARRTIIGRRVAGELLVSAAILPAILLIASLLHL